MYEEVTVGQVPSSRFCRDTMGSELRFSGALDGFPLVFMEEGDPNKRLALDTMLHQRF